jgi:CBS domain-containing protein
MNATLNRRTETPLVLHACTAEDLMAANPISIRAEAGIPEAIALFTEKGITAAPVIDEAGHPIGVVSRSDLLIHQREHDRALAAKPEYFFPSTFGSAETPREVKPTGRSTVAELMTPAIFSVAPATPATRVINDMLGLHVHRLFVVDDDGVLIGVISTMDVLRHLRPES